jgi:hypothetical protein
MNRANSLDAGPAEFEPADVPNALVQIARLAEGVKWEFDLIASRMSWLVIAESFIFSAFATAIANSRPDHPQAAGLGYLIRVMPVVGMFLAAFVYMAILAAHRAIGTLKTQREAMIDRLPAPLRIDLIATGSRVQMWGNLPTHIIPPLLFAVWAGGLAMLKG